METIESIETIDEIILFIKIIKNISFIYTEYTKYSHNTIKLNYGLFFDYDYDFILKKEAYTDMFDLNNFIKSIKSIKLFNKNN